jgi:hypothetical protein
VTGNQAEVELEPPRGSKALGIVGMSVGGGAVFAGLIVAFLGVVDDRRSENGEGLGPAPGLIVVGAGLGLTTGGIIYTLYSRSGYKPMYKQSAAAPGPRIGIGAGGIAGAF